MYTLILYLKGTRKPFIVEGFQSDSDALAFSYPLILDTRQLLLQSGDVVRIIRRQECLAAYLEKKEVTNVHYYPKN